MKCEECKYWEDYDDGKGACHRYPPTYTFGLMCLNSQIEGNNLPEVGTQIIDDSNKGKGEICGTIPTVETAVWILTYNYDWCGEFKAK